ISVDTPNVFNEGSPFVTTCPFGPNTSYTYSDFFAHGFFPSTTFFHYRYHSQLSLQYADGLRVAFVIYDPEDPQAHLYDVDDESTIWTVADWWHNTSVSGLASYNATQIIPGLFNGAGRYQGGPEVPYAVQTVTTGTRYRFRIINLSARADFVVSIDNRMSSTFSMSSATTSLYVINCNITMSFFSYLYLQVTADQPIGNYWINAIPQGGNPAHNLNFNSTLGRGILRYEGAPAEEPATPMTLGPQDANLLNEADLHPLNPIPASISHFAAPEPNYILDLTTSMPVDLTVWEINSISYIPPTVPTLIKILDGASNASDFDVHENTFVFEKNKVVENLRLTFFPTFHLHGNKFWVIKSNATDTVNTVNPIIRDVRYPSSTGSGGTIFRFTTDKPVFWHFVAGLGSVMVSDPEAIREQVHPTDAWGEYDALCPAYNALPPSEQ
ncbi:Cupredoxin, partial [Mycena maculata]